MLQNIHLYFFLVGHGWHQQKKKIILKIQNKKNKKFNQKLIYICEEGRERRQQTYPQKWNCHKK
jgi:hypothetical protein